MEIGLFHEHNSALHPMRSMIPFQGKGKEHTAFHLAKYLHNNHIVRIMAFHANLKLW